MTISPFEAYPERARADTLNAKDSLDETFKLTANVLPRKLIKRPLGRPPPRTAPVPISLPPLRPASSYQPVVLTLEEKQQRQMHSFLRNFLSASGHFEEIINLHQHGIDSGTIVTDATVQEVVVTVPQLLGLNLSTCSHVTDAGLLAIARFATRNFHTIHLAHCNKITELGLRHLAHSCRLVFVDLSDCPQLNNTVLQSLAAGSWMIETFIMQRCQGVSDPGIVKLAQCCKNLRHLDISGCLHIGEYGDKALLAVGTFCPLLRILDLYGCQHVHDPGLRAIAKGCPFLSTLRLSNCQSITSAAIRALTQHCLQLETLSLAGCVKLINRDLEVVSTNCCQLTWLDISGSPNVGAIGLRAIAQNCTSLAYLNLAACQRVGDNAVSALTSAGARGLTKSLRELSLENCARITENGVEQLVAKCCNLLTLNLTNCHFISQRFLQQVIAKLQLVQSSIHFFGFEPLPNADELCRQRDAVLLRDQCAFQIQGAIRCFLARKQLWQAKRWFLANKHLPTIQARVRGLIVRKQLAFENQKQLQDVAARLIGRAYRHWQLRRMWQRVADHCRLQKRNEMGAIRVQKVFRGSRARHFVLNMRNEIEIKRQCHARQRAREGLTALTVQRIYRGYRGRRVAANLRSIERFRQEQHEREKVAATCIQRMYRGFQGRLFKAQCLANEVQNRKKDQSATKIQQLFRGQRARRHVDQLRKEAIRIRRLMATITIQRYWRSLCEKHRRAVLLGLIQLRLREKEAAQSIQAAYRLHVSRGVTKAMKQVIAIQLRREKAALDIQRLLRGHNGRTQMEVHRQLERFCQQAKPLLAKEVDLQTQVTTLLGKMEHLQSQKAREEKEERSLALELEKTLLIKTKYHDSSRISGTLQRYLTQYLQVQLAAQLREKRTQMARFQQRFETVQMELNNSQHDLRAVRRQLEPLTNGVVTKTRDDRVLRLQTKVRLARQAALRIQKIYRGYRVRVAVWQGGNCWILMHAFGQGQRYYYNTLTGALQWHWPLSMKLFEDTLQEPLQIDRVHGTWYKGLDDTLDRLYYFNCDTKEYQWDTLEILDHHATFQQREIWLQEQMHDCETLLATSDVIVPLLGQWEKRVAQETGYVFFSHPLSKEVTLSLSPQSIHNSLGENIVKSRRSVRSIRTLRSVEWQYRYGYAYDGEGNLVVWKNRPIWTEHTDPDNGFVYYYNALRDEYRWTKPSDYDMPYEVYVNGHSASTSARKWFEVAKITLESEEGALHSTRSLRSRMLGKKWVELIDPETCHTYYYNQVTGESRWSLSPRSARDTCDSDDDLPLALLAHIKHLRESPVPYSSREQHMSWLNAAVSEKDWKKADVIVQQIYIREQSQVVTEQKARKEDTVTSQEVDTGTLEMATSPWIECRDEDNQATYYYNKATGETSWSIPSTDLGTEAATLESSG